jgi:lactobin A/cerein 7B family class IIb bacteriocin
MKELTSNELEQVNGGAVFLVPAAVYVAKVVGAATLGGAIAGATAALVKYMLK